MSPAVVALAGNPNTGKTSLFNALTGSRQKVGNWPGVTVERKEGRLALGADDVTLVDLPGVYSLGASSIDEQIAADFLRNERPGAVVTVVDATNLERSLYLAAQLRESGVPVIVALNMWDLAEKKGISVDIARLEALLGVDVVPTAATNGTGLDELRGKIASRLAAAKREDKPLALPYGAEVERSLTAIAKALPGGMTDHERRLLAIRTAEGDSAAVSGLPGAEAILAAATSENGRIEKALEYDLQTAVILKRWDFISGVTGQVLRRDPAKSSGTTWDERLDRIVTNRFLGLPLFLLVAWGVFQSVFAIGDSVADHLDGLLGAFGEASATWLATMGAGATVTSLIQDGVIAGVGSVLVFVPHIFLFFFFLSILEDCGYMARGAFVMDRILRALGLHGKSFIPMLLGFGCNVPSIMATRILERPRDRMITLLVLPFMSCSARLPVYLLFAGTFFGERAGTVVFALYVLGIVVAVTTAKVLGSTIFAGEPSQFVMELPAYRLPKLSATLRAAGERAMLFIRKAGTFIFGAVICVWLLASLPFGVEYGSADSLVGRLGALLAPLLAPAGFGFRQAGVALFFGFLAKEVVLGTFGTLLGTGEDGLAAALPALFTPLSALAFLVMTLLYVPCVAVVAAFRRETNSWKWTIFLVAYTTIVGYALAVAVYQGGRLFGLS
jgi:ferrous iron transport protein B